MGRIKTRVLKTVTKDLMTEHGEKFDTEFAKNKEIVAKNTDIRSKKLKNIIAGYATRLKKSGNY